MQESHIAGARAVTTNQADIYDKLEEVVRKYATTDYLRPIADHTRAAFGEAEKFIEGFYNKIPAGHSSYKVILDSGCGTGESTLNIARQHPDIPVIGIDKSAARLTKAGGAGVNGASAFPQNAFLVRAELLDFWRLALEAVQAGRWHIPYHALYFPNPWPKQSEATRRFHLHPIFPTLLQLGDTIELRTNWEIYAREFAEAARIAKKIPTLVAMRTKQQVAKCCPPGQAGDDKTCAGDDNTGTISCEAFEPERPITAFERKYKEARQQLWRVSIHHK